MVQNKKQEEPYCTDNQFDIDSIAYLVISIAE
jgi:hypothetical protein